MSPSPSGSPRSFGAPDATGYGMIYNNMQHAQGSGGDFYGRPQSGKAQKKTREKKERNKIGWHSHYSLLCIHLFKIITFFCMLHLEKEMQESAI